MADRQGLLIQRLAEQAIEVLDTRKINPYISLAKAVLWMVGVSLVFILAGCFFLVVKGDAEQIGNVVGAAQGLLVLALAVMGWHGFEGSQALYLLRHLGQKDVLNSAPDPAEPEAPAPVHQDSVEGDSRVLNPVLSSVDVGSRFLSRNGLIFKLYKMGDASTAYPDHCFWAESEDGYRGWSFRADGQYLEDEQNEHDLVERITEAPNPDLAEETK